MNQHTKDVYLIPSVIAVVAGLLLIPVAAWFTNVPMRTVVTFAGIKNLWFAPLPAWVGFMFFAAALFAVYLYRRSRTELREEEQCTARLRQEAGIVQDQIKLIQRDHEAELAALKSKEPKLHGIWIPTQAYWAHGAHGTQAATQVVGWIDISSSNTKENIFLLAGYINGRRAQIFGDLTVKPGVVNKSQVFLFFWPPLETKEGEPFETTIVVEDQFNRKYELPKQEFHSTPGQKPVPAFRVEPKLHLAWRFVGWCWTDVDEVMITGDGTFVLDNVKGEVMFTGVKVEGAEVTDVFDGFTLKPGEPYFTGISVKFKGLKPKDDVPLKATLTFIDLRGNEYPVDEHEFKLLEHPERFGGIPF